MAGNLYFAFIALCNISTFKTRINVMPLASQCQTPRVIFEITYKSGGGLKQRGVCNRKVNVLIVLLLKLRNLVAA